MTITCNEQVFKVHKAVLTMRGGSFFERLICSGFSETHTSNVDLPDDDPNVIARLLRHIYTGSYTEQISPGLHQDEDEEPTENVMLETVVERSMVHVNMFAAAVKFGIDALREEARKAFMEAFYCGLGNDYISQIPHGSIKFVSAVYNTTPPQERELRDCVLYEALLERDRWAEYHHDGSPIVHIDMLREVPELAVDLLTYQLRISGDAWICKECDECMGWIPPLCKCNKMYELCDEPECLDMELAASQCVNCFRKGTLRPEADDE